MATYEIKRVDMKHESGTKRYSIYSISSDGVAGAAVVSNWGTTWLTFGSHPIVDLRGATKITLTSYHASARESRKIIASKEKRGYRSLMLDASFQTEDRAEFIAKIKYLLKPAQSEMVIKHMGLETDFPETTAVGIRMAEIETIIMDEISNEEDLSVWKKKVATSSPKSIELDRGPNWGSW